MKALAVPLLLLVLTGATATEIIVKSGGTCTAYASSNDVATAKDAFAHAMADVSKVGCSATSADDLFTSVYKRLKVCAEALAEVQVDAVVVCHTYGPNSFGCAEATAYAKTQAHAMITLISEASARASNLGCRQCASQFANATTFNTATLVAQLQARVAAKTKAAVCVGPNETASARAFAECSGQVWAVGLAKAVAWAMISGGCTQLNADARTTALAIIKADATCRCVGWVCTHRFDKSCIYARPPGAGLDRLAALKTLAPSTYAEFYNDCTARFYV